MDIRFTPLDSASAAAYRAGAADANGQPPERHIAHVDGLPCRHCLAMIAKGEPYLILAHRPFPAPQPYAEVGPIFLHANDCEADGGSNAIPVFLDSPRYIVRGYGADQRIVYGTGTIVETAELANHARRLLADPRIAYAHVRSATNNCYHCRIERA